MNCPYCQNEVIPGRVNSTASGFEPVQHVFLTEEEANKGFMDLIKETVQEIRMGCAVEYGVQLRTNEVAYYCEECGKVFAEYDLRNTD